MSRPPADRGQQSHSPEDGDAASGGGGSSCSRCPSTVPIPASFQSEAEPRPVPRCTYSPGRSPAGHRSRGMETEVHVPIGAPAVPKFAIYVDETDVIPGALALIGKLRPKWDVSQVKTK
eukprot:g38895.t1